MNADIVGAQRPDPSKKGSPKHVVRFKDDEALNGATGLFIPCSTREMAKIVAELRCAHPGIEELSKEEFGLMQIECVGRQQLRSFSASTKKVFRVMGDLAKESNNVAFSDILAILDKSGQEEAEAVLADIEKLVDSALVVVDKDDQSFGGGVRTWALTPLGTILYIEKSESTSK